MSLDLVEETMASDPGGDEVRTADSALESTREVEIKDLIGTIAEETKVEVSSSEIKTTGDVQLEDAGLEEERQDPTEISLDDLTGGLDMEGKPTGEELEEGELEASEEKETVSDDELETETDLVQVSEEAVEEDKEDLVQVTENKLTGEEVLEGCTGEKESNGEVVEQENEGEITDDKGDSSGELGEIKDDKGDNSGELGEIKDDKGDNSGELGEIKDELMESKSTGEEEEKETTKENEEIKDELVNSVSGDQNQEVLEGPVEESTGEEVLEDSSIVEETKVEVTETEPLEKSENPEKVLEEGIEHLEKLDNTEKVLEERNEEAPAVPSEVPAVPSEAPSVTSEAPAGVSELAIEEKEEAMEITCEVKTDNVPMEVDLNCANNEIGEAELTVHDFIIVEENTEKLEEEVGERIVQVGPTFDEFQSNIELGEETIEERESNTKIVSPNQENKEAVVYHRREKHTTKAPIVGPDSSVTQSPIKEEIIEIPVKYNLPSAEKDHFVIYDLVWGKVKSHPWWPGLIISPSDASNLATKYQKRDAFLVAYFGDKTFAWCEESQLKPFFENFTHFVKQASSDAFYNAVKCVLNEVSRRFEVGTICSCLNNKLYFKDTYPKIENAGVKQGFGNCEINRGEIVNYYNSEDILGFVKNLGLDPYKKGTNDKLGLVIITSLTKSFYRSKGYSNHAKYQTFSGPLEDYIEPIIPDKSLENAIITYEDNNNTTDNDINTTLALTTSSSIFTPVILPKKGININININQAKDIIIDPPPKRKRGRPPKNKNQETDKKSPSINGSRSNNKPDKSLVTYEDDSSPSLSSWKKQKPTVDFDFVDRESTKTITPASGFGFKIGACISRAASRLTGSGSQPVMNMPKFDRTDFDVSSDEENVDDNNNKEVSYYHHSGEKKERRRRLKKYHYSNPEEILSQLCLIARTPMKQYIFVSNVVGYFTDFRKFIVPVPEQEQPVPVSVETGTVTVPEKVKQKRGRKRKVDLSLAQVQTEELINNNIINNQLQDSYWSDMILSNQNEEPNMQPKVYKRRANIETKSSLLLPSSNRNIIRIEEKRLRECNPTALLLNFSTRFGTVPSEMDLVRIFSRFGALKGEMESKIEGSVSKVKIVFKRRADADLAFGSLRRENVFGPALLSYRLVYLSELEKESTVTNGEHSELQVPARVENIDLTSGARVDDVCTVEVMDTSAMSIDQSSIVQTEVPMVSEMLSEMPSEPSVMVQDESSDKLNENAGEENETGQSRDEMEIDESRNVQVGDETITENDALKTVREAVIEENAGEENETGQLRDEMEIDESRNVQIGDETITENDALKTVREAVIEEIEKEEAVNLSENNIRDEMENEGPVNQSESSLQVEMEDEGPINQSETSLQVEMENEGPINLSENNIIKDEVEKEEPINQSESSLQVEGLKEKTIDPSENNNIQGEMENEKTIESVNTQIEVEEEKIIEEEKTNIQIEVEEETIIEEEKTNDPAGAEGEIGEKKTNETAGADVAEEGKIIEEEKTNDPAGAEDEIGEKEANETAGADVAETSIDEPNTEQGGLTGDKPEQGEIIGDKEGLSEDKPEQGEIVGEQGLSEEHEQGEIVGDKEELTQEHEQGEIAGDKEELTQEHEQGEIAGDNV